MERFTVDGIVVKTSVTGESDYIVWVLTRNRGVLRAFAKGARGTKSKLHGAVSQFCYGTFTFFENKGVFSISEAVLSEAFFALRNDFTTLTLSQYFCEVVLKCVEENTDSEDYLRLLLNCLHFFCTGSRPPEQIKCIFELRFACIAGYAPMLVACDECGEYETPVMYFDCSTGQLFCSSCGQDRALPSLPVAAVSVMRHIVFSKFGSVFSFTAEPEVLDSVSRLTQQYLQNAVQQRFNVLRYLNEITDS